MRPRPRFCRRSTLWSQPRTQGEPLIVPDEDERDGYAPNVVYSCGAMSHGEHPIIAYALADTRTMIATVSMAELLDEPTSSGPQCSHVHPL